jgi:hypothetical protein
MECSRRKHLAIQLLEEVQVSARSTEVIDETERARRIWDKQAPRFDRMMGFWEKVLFAGGREWA